MNPIKAVRNQFLGINPLLHSQLQVAGGWDHFHVNHISDLTRLLQRDLHSMGYLAQAEQSLQIRRRAIGIYQKTADDTRRCSGVAGTALASQQTGRTPFCDVS
jgi:hypothetical protein